MIQKKASERDFMLRYHAMAINFGKILAQMEEAIEKLKVRYELYFLGMERFAPVKDLKAVERTIRAIRSEVMGNTAQKFKLRMLIQRFTTYKSHWNRIQREIDEGRYRRDLARIQRDLRKRGVQAKDLLKARNASEVEVALMKYMKEAREIEARQALEEKTVRPQESAQADEKQAAAGQPAPASAGASPPPLPVEALAQRKPGGNANSSFKRLYDAYIEARRKTGQPIKGLTYDKMVQSINKQLSGIREKHGSRKVEFCVVVKEGKAILKAVPK